VNRVLVVKDVVTHYGQIRALGGVSLQVNKGEIVTLIGANGAGKTTTIRMIMGILLPDEGRIRVRGQSLDGSVKDLAGYLPEERGLYRKMKVTDLLAFFGRSHGLSAGETTRRIVEKFHPNKIILFGSYAYGKPRPESDVDRKPCAFCPRVM
jgi:ABC-2 type transport system ATP-binding protein